jgi:hypothetical protein
LVGAGYRDHRLREPAVLIIDQDVHVHVKQVGEHDIGPAVIVQVGGADIVEAGGRPRSY